MRRTALFDANVVVSMLIADVSSGSLMTSIVESAIAGAYIPVLTVAARREVLAVIERNASLRRRTSPERIATLFTILAVGTARCSPPREPIPLICRDPRDDYLLEEAHVCGATHLVTGDRDLLVLDGGFPFRIMTPRQFAEALGLDTGE